MTYLFESRTLEELERAVCRLESMGTILRSLCAPDQALPDLSSLADLGTLISRQAMEALDLLGEKAAGTQLRHRPMPRASSEEAPVPRAWYVPEIPSD